MDIRRFGVDVRIDCRLDGHIRRISLSDGRVDRRGIATRWVLVLGSTERQIAVACGGQDGEGHQARGNDSKVHASLSTPTTFRLRALGYGRKIAPSL